VTPFTSPRILLPAACPPSCYARASRAAAVRSYRNASDLRVVRELWGSPGLHGLLENEHSHTPPSPHAFEKLSGGSPVPALGILQIRRNPYPHLGEVAHSILGLGEPGQGRLSSPEVRLRIALLEHAFAPRQVPPAQRQLRLVLPLRGGLRVPHDGQSRVDGAAPEPVLVGAAHAELAELVAEIGRLHEQLEDVDHILLFFF